MIWSWATAWDCVICLPFIYPRQIHCATITLSYTAGNKAWDWWQVLLDYIYIYLVMGNVECYLLQYSVHTCRLCTNWLEMRKYVQITITLQYWANRYYGHHTIDHPILVGPPPKTARGIVSWFHDWNIVLYQLCGDLRYYLLCWSRLIWTWRVWIPTDHATGLMQP